MKLYSIYNLPAKNYFLSFDDGLKWLVQEGDLQEEAAKVFQSELNEYYAENCNTKLSSVLHIQTKLDKLKLEIQILLHIPRSILYSQTKEIEHILKKFGLSDSEKSLKDIQRKISVRKNKISELIGKLPKGSETPTLKNFHYALDLIESVESVQIDDKITFDRFCHKLNNATRSKNNGTTR